MATMPRPDESTSAESVKHAAEAAKQAAQNAVRKTAEQTVRVAEVAAETNTRATRAGADIIQRNAETVQQAMQSGAKMAGRLAERSADQFGRAMGLSGDEARKAAQKSSESLDAIIRSTSVFADGSQRLASEWFDFARERIEQNFGRAEQIMHCRTPHDALALQHDLMRENLHKFLDFARHFAEQSVRVAEDATRRLEDGSDRARASAA